MFLLCIPTRVFWLCFVLLTRTAARLRALLSACVVWVRGEPDSSVGVGVGVGVGVCCVLPPLLILISSISSISCCRALVLLCAFFWLLYDSVFLAPLSFPSVLYSPVPSCPALSFPD